MAIWCHSIEERSSSSHTVVANLLYTRLGYPSDTQCSTLELQKVAINLWLADRPTPSVELLDLKISSPNLDIGADAIDPEIDFTIDKYWKIVH